MTVMLIDDTFNGISGKLTTDGYEFTRTAIITGLTVSNTAIKKMADCINGTGDCSELSVPFLGDDLGTVTSITALNGCWLRSITPDPIKDSTDSMHMTYQYKSNPWQDFTVESGATLSQVETNKDVRGDVVTLKYTYPDDYQKTELQGKTVEKSPLLTKDEPDRTLTFNVREGYDPNDYAGTYVGTVNEFDWRNGLAKEWKCAGITGRSDSSGSGYFNNTYSFHHRKGGWDEEITFIDPETGAAVPDADADSQKTIEHYAVADFEQLFAVS